MILGVIVGLVMLGLGYYWRKRYPIMTQVLSGGGIAVLYLSIFASFATYHLVSIYLAIVLLLVISILSTVLALRYNSMALAILGILGAFFAPYILGAFSDRGTGDGTRGQAMQLLAYLIVIDIGVLLLSTFRNWRWFTLLALACSLITYGFWYREFENLVSIAIAEIGITAIFLSFAGATYLFHIVRRRIPEVFEYILMSGTAAAYAGISLGMMWDKFRPWMGGFVLLLAIFYGLLAYLAHKRSPENNRLSAVLAGHRHDFPHGSHPRAVPRPRHDDHSLGSGRGSADVAGFPGENTNFPLRKLHRLPARGDTPSRLRYLGGR